MRSQVFSPKPIPPPFLPTPIQVFISSDEDEFRDIREELRKVISSEYMYNQERTTNSEEWVHQGIVMQGFLVEGQSAESFAVAMKKGLENSQIYVGIFGNKYSETTVKEYEKACKLGLPLVIYYFTMPPRKGKGLRNKVIEFLERDVKPLVKIGGNYNRVILRNKDDLIDHILAELASRTTDLVRESVSIRRAVIEGAPSELVDVVFRARKSSLE